MKKDDTKVGFFIVLGAAALAASFSAGKKSQQAAQAAQEAAESSRPALIQPAPPVARRDPAPQALEPSGYRERPDARERPQDRISRP